MNIPRCMSTQHPDNVSIPFFSDSSILEGECEIKEAYYAFSLGVEEQMWDYEGKEVDNFVVKKLLTRYEEFFRKNRPGRDVFITLRLPNPEVEKNEAKVLIETLQSIPRSCDVAKMFYNEDVTPIFEVILPMTSSSSSLLRVAEFYNRFIVGMSDEKLCGVSVKDWVGEFRPTEVNVIPLIEDKNSLLNAKEIVKGYITSRKPEYQRVFLARSDPALNYGSLAASLLNKLTLFELSLLEEECSVPIHPIVGFGSSPFRGNLNPYTSYRIMGEFEGVQTFTIQSSFKYDYVEQDVRKAVDYMKTVKKRKPKDVEREGIVGLIERCAEEYSKNVLQLKNLVIEVAKHVPERRRRKLHIGLFGYSRMLSELALPRAIPFACAFYSIGIPPEVFDIAALSQKDFETIDDVFATYKDDLRDAMKYLNEENLYVLPEKLRERVLEIKNELSPETSEEHNELTRSILKKVMKGKSGIGEEVLATARIRRFLG